MMKFSNTSPTLSMSINVFFSQSLKKKLKTKYIVHCHSVRYQERVIEKIVTFHIANDNHNLAIMVDKFRRWFFILLLIVIVLIVILLSSERNVIANDPFI